MFIGVFLTLMFLGSRAAAAPYVLASKLFTALYFAYFLVVLPALALLGESSAKSINKRSDSRILEPALPATCLNNHTTTGTAATKSSLYLNARLLGGRNRQLSATLDNHVFYQPVNTKRVFSSSPSPSSPPPLGGAGA